LHDSVIGASWINHCEASFKLQNVFHEPVEVIRISERTEEEIE
jgi:hypothetical protein